MNRKFAPGSASSSRFDCHMAIDRNKVAAVFRPAATIGIRSYGTVILRTCPRPFGGGPKPTFET